MRIALLAAVVTIAASLTGIGAASAPRAVAVLPLVPHLTGLPDAPTPSPEQLAQLTGDLRGGLHARGVTVVPARAVAAALRRAGFDQRLLARACTTARCAQRIGAMVGARTVVTGNTTRAMALIWATDAQLVDVASGRASGPVQAGYKGDFETMRVGMDELAGALARALR